VAQIRPQDRIELVPLPIVALARPAIARATPYRGHYVTSDGRIITSRVRFSSNRRLDPHQAKFRRLFPGKRGWVAVKIDYVTHYVHVLVLEAFAGPRPPGAVGRHLNGDKLDNRIKNLKWA
jgi:hypothetical protein